MQYCRTASAPGVGTLPRAYARPQAHEARSLPCRPVSLREGPPLPLHTGHTLRIDCNGRELDTVSGRGPLMLARGSVLWLQNCHMRNFATRFTSVAQGAWPTGSTQIVGAEPSVLRMENSSLRWLDLVRAVAAWPTCKLPNTRPPRGASLPLSVSTAHARISQHATVRA